MIKKKLILQLIHTYGRNEADLTDENDNYHRMRIFCAKFHHIYENLIITGGWDDTLRVSYYLLCLSILFFFILHF